MQDFFCTDPDDMNYKQLADKVRYFKEDEKGVATMCKVLEEMRDETAIQTTVKNLKQLMKNLKLSLEQAMDALSIPEEKRGIYSDLLSKSTK